MIIKKHKPVLYKMFRSFLLKQFKIEKPNTTMDFFSKLASIIFSSTRLVERKLLPDSYECIHCKKSTTNGYGWQCIYGQCPKRLTRTIRPRTFFEKSRLPLTKLLYLMYLWIQDTIVKNAAETTGLFQKTVVQMYQYSPAQLGGHSIVVQIDDSLYNHKSKYQRGRRPSNETWVFGITDTSTKPSITYMEAVAKRDKVTLLPIIEKIVRAGSIIYSDEWRAYSQIQEKLGFNIRLWTTMLI